MPYKLGQYLTAQVGPHLKSVINDNGTTKGEAIV